MSETQSKSAAVVAEKIQNLRGEVAQASDTAAKFASYDKFNLLFNGMRLGMECADADEGTMRPVAAALGMIDKQLAALEADVELEEALAAQ